MSELQRMLDAMASLPKRKEWSEMSAEEQIAEAISHGAELRVSDCIEPGAIARRERKGGQQVGPRMLDNVSLGALHYLRRTARDALETGPDWYGTIDAKELRGGG